MAGKSETSGNKGPRSDFPVPMDFENLAEVNYTAVNAAGVVGQRWCDALAVMNGEILDFVGKRLKEDMVIPTGLAGCTSGEQIFELYSDFFRKAVNQYFEEAEKLAHIGANFVGAATKVVEDEAELVHKIAAD